MHIYIYIYFMHIYIFFMHIYIYIYKLCIYIERNMKRLKSMESFRHQSHRNEKTGKRKTLAIIGYSTVCEKNDEMF